MKTASDLAASPTIIDNEGEETAEVSIADGV
jgi:hypothetical protein